VDLHVVSESGSSIDQLGSDGVVLYNGKCLVVRLNSAAFSYIRSSYVSSIIDVARTVFTKAKFA